MEQELKEFGLSTKEVKVYLAILKLGNAPVVNITKITSISRSTVYDTLNSLISKGLVKSYMKDKKTHFDATNPNVLLQRQKDKEKIIRRLLPDLHAIAGRHTEKPNVEIFEGIKGIHSLLDELYTSKELVCYGCAYRLKKELGHLPESLARRRVEKKIFLRAVMENSKEAFFRMKDTNISKFSEIRKLDLMEKFTTMTIISEKSVAIISLSNQIVGVKITDPNINKTHKLIFETFWNMTQLKLQNK
jgi:HTH-type transcriptional regulator, sugar sensing transcriptional regulator